MNFGMAFALLCVGLASYHLFSGKIVGRGGWEATREKNPGSYWLTIAVEIAFALSMAALAIHDILNEASWLFWWF
jgi:hypothetical protein